MSFGMENYFYNLSDLQIVYEIRIIKNHLEKFPENPVISSDRIALSAALEEARKRGLPIGYPY